MRGYTNILSYIHPVIKNITIMEELKHLIATTLMGNLFDGDPNSQYQQGYNEALQDILEDLTSIMAERQDGLLENFCLN